MNSVKRVSQRILFLIVLAICSHSEPLWADGSSDQSAVTLEPHTNKHVGRLVGNQVVIGQLDEHGEFRRIESIPPVRRDSPGGTGYDYEVMNLPRCQDEVVYEFRGSCLIKGRLDQQGRFIPEVGSTVIPLSQYQIGRNAPRIYNLPGVLVPAKR